MRFRLTVLYVLLLSFTGAPALARTQSQWDLICQDARAKRAQDKVEFETQIRDFVLLLSTKEPDSSRFYAVERRLTEAQLKILDGIGVVTREEDVFFNGGVDGFDARYASQAQHIGTAFLIGRCHVLTALHVLNKAMGGDGRVVRVKNGDPFYFHVGQGATCQGRRAFEFHLPGQVVELGENYEDFDWALIRLARPAPAAIPHIPAGDLQVKDKSGRMQDVIKKGDVVMSFGYPVESARTDRTIHNLYGFLARVSRTFLTRSVILSTSRHEINGVKLRAGMSGGPLLWPNHDPATKAESPLLAIGILFGGDADYAEYTGIQKLIEDLWARDKKLKASNPKTRSTIEHIQATIDAATSCE